jgi:nitrous oxide reductase
MPIDRRGFLGALALAPAAVAACATGGAAATPERPPARDAPQPAPARRAPGGLDAVRDLPLPPSAEPSFTFRAVAFRPGEP